VKIDLRGNVKGVGNAYLTIMRTGHRSLLQDAVTVESEFPWRRGPGRGVHLWPGRLLVVGWWTPDYAEDEDPFDQEELGEVEVDIAPWHSIRNWGADYALSRGDLREAEDGAGAGDRRHAPAPEEAPVP
jgi:hypothetical protein